MSRAEDVTIREPSFFRRSPLLHTDAAGTALPDEFGSFRVVQQSGAGTLGPVFRGHDAARDLPVAIKLFKIDIAPDAARDLAANLQHIVDARLAHPAIIAPRWAGLKDNSAFLVSEYVAGESLDLVLRQRGPLTPTEAVRIATAVAGALDAAAAVRIAHGSLHPRDVLLAADTVRLTGLGVAQSLDQSGIPAPVRRSYAPPERVSGGPWDSRADVFTLAAIVYEMMFGKHISGAGKQRIQDLSPVAGVDMSALERAFEHALASQPVQRTATAGAFVDALRAACSPESRSSESERPEKAQAADSEVPAATALSAFPSERGVSPADGEPVRRPPSEPSIAGDADAEKFARLRPAPTPAPTRLVAPTPEDVPSRRPEPRRNSVVESRIAALRVEPEEPPRFVDVEIPPARVEMPPDVRLRPPKEIEPALPPMPPLQVGMDTGRGAPIELRMIERSRSAVWPLLLALLVGGALGFAGGYTVRDNPALRQSIDGVVATSGREFTENAVPEPHKPAAQPQAVPPAESLSPAGAAASPIAPKSDAIGRLAIRTSPAGARVFVDDREAGRTTTTVADLSAGPHQLRLERDGYATVERQFMITRAQPNVSLNVSLERARTVATPGAPQRTAPATSAARSAPAAAPPRVTPDSLLRGRTASLTVESRPTGARVYVDDRLIGTTPLSMPDVDVGDHVLRMEHDGYRRWLSSIRVIAGDANRVTASLER